MPAPCVVGDQEKRSRHPPSTEPPAFEPCHRRTGPTSPVAGEPARVDARRRSSLRGREGGTSSRWWTSLGAAGGGGQVGQGLACPPAPCVEPRRQAMRR